MFKSFGLVNIGNTCYANSAIQFLFSIDDIINYIIKDFDWTEALKEICKSKQVKTENDVINIIKQYFIVNLYKFITNSSEVKNPLFIFSLLNKGSGFQFILGEQNDSQELLYVLFDSLNEEFYRIENNIDLETEIKITDYHSIVSDILQNEIKTKTTYTDKNEESEITEKDLFIYLYPHDEDKTIQDLINNIRDKQIVDNNTEIIRESKIIKSSKYIICIISRFKNLMKNSQSIEILENVKINDKQYSIHSIISHSGSLFGGHYINYSKHGDKWYLFNDSYVSEMEIKDILKNVSSGSAYVVLYKLDE